MGSQNVQGNKETSELKKKKMWKVDNRQKGMACPRRQASTEQAALGPVPDTAVLCSGHGSHTDTPGESKAHGTCPPATASAMNVTLP